ncbi:hypothetical protein N7474_006741 [Penicillium riverlandense]|uniref:uncharacterized protein n=1 Tax=Penicillium riverlandense TaxID=1903569 RepID=UPI00254697FF|nr:uncharacterized protein N7474_006741 [Penicillium riverlandense]KAJ5814964.1 hypothetical protein N7474_006741 [Penicillium riverlandense]
MANNQQTEQPCQPNDSDPGSAFSFSPIQAIRAVPHLWDRKPSTPLAGPKKTRKLWKRFRSSFTSMKNLVAAEDNNTQRTTDASYPRGVKRLCIGPDGAGDDTDSAIEQRGRSFLETKWESDVTRKRRKLPDGPLAIHEDHAAQPDLNDVNGDEVNKVLREVQVGATMNASPRPFSILDGFPKHSIYDKVMDAENLDPIVSEAKPTDDLQSGPSDTNQHTPIENARANETTAVQDLTQEQEGTLVRSALRSSLDGEDAELLNDFLSRAKAKRAAKAALMKSQGIEAVDNSSSPDESPEAECSTPRSRRALEALDTNSPSPIKMHPSPSKDGSPPSTVEMQEGQREAQVNEDPAPASSVPRRSTRAKTPAGNGPTARNTIALRRAKGTEFVFLQRTEAQELALATRRNTRHNKGSSVMPKYALEALAQQQQNDETDSNNSSSRGSDRKGAHSKLPAKPRKNVAWNDERLAEYEDDPVDDAEEEAEGDNSKPDVDGASRLRSGTKRPDKRPSSTGGRRSRSQTQQIAEVSEGSDSLPTAPPAIAASTTPRSRRVRRLDSGSMRSGTPVKTGSRSTSSTNKRPTTAASSTAAASGSPSTPTKGRRKLTPKSPRSSLLPAPSSKSTNGTTTASEHSFVSGIPRSTSTKSFAPAAPAEGTKRQISAGSTPMPRRVRARP